MPVHAPRTRHRLSPSAARRLVGFGLLGAVLAVVAASPARAQQAIEASPDVTTGLSGTVLGHEEIAEDLLAGGVSISGPGVAFPPGVDLDGFDRFPGSNELVSTDVTVAFASGLVARPGDVVLTGATGDVLAFSAQLAGLPPGTRVDAVARDVGSGLLLSFDTTVQLDGTTFDDADVARVSGTAPAQKAFDAAAAGIAPGLDLDAVYREPDGTLLVSFDTSGSAGGVVFHDEDLLRVGGGTLAPAYSGGALHAGWLAADLDAASAVDDADGDGVPDAEDNCRLLANATQLDTDADAIGNPCDCDFDDDGTCNIADFNLFLLDFQNATDSGIGSDMDGDGSVGIGDFNLFLAGFQSSLPGP